MSNIAVDLLLDAVKAAILGDPQRGEKVELTPDVGALVRDKGLDIALASATVRQRVGFLNDVTNCSTYIRPRYRRRMR